MLDKLKPRLLHTIRDLHLPTLPAEMPGHLLGEKLLVLDNQ